MTRGRDVAGSAAGNVHSGVRRDDVLGRPVIRFVEERVLGSASWDPRDAKSVGR